MTEKTYNKELNFRILSENLFDFSKESLHPFMKPYVLKVKKLLALNLVFTVNGLNSVIYYINNSFANNKDFKVLLVDIKPNSLDRVFAPCFGAL